MVLEYIMDEGGRHEQTEYRRAVGSEGGVHCEGEESLEVGLGHRCRPSCLECLLWAL